MKTKVPAWVSIMIVAIMFIIVGFAFWWYTGGKSEYESRHPSAETLAWRKELAQSETFKGAPFSMPKPAPSTKLEFSAKMINVHIIDGKKLTDPGRLYYEKGVKYRNEMKSPDGSHTTIVWFDKHGIWNMNDTDKTYTGGFGGIARTGAGDDYVVDIAILKKDPTCKHLGTEHVDGKLCDKYVQGDPGSAVTVWVSRKIPGLCLKRVYQTEIIRAILANPINTRMKNGPDIPVSIELRNVRLGHQPDSLFELPKGYKRATMSYSTGLMVPNGALSGVKHSEDSSSHATQNLQQKSEVIPQQPVDVMTGFQAIIIAVVFMIFILLPGWYFIVHLPMRSPLWQRRARDKKNQSISFAITSSLLVVMWIGIAVFNFLGSPPELAVGYGIAFVCSALLLYISAKRVPENAKHSYNMIVGSMLGGGLGECYVGGYWIAGLHPWYILELLFFIAAILLSIMAEVVFLMRHK